MPNAVAFNTTLTIQYLKYNFHSGRSPSKHSVLTPHRALTHSLTHSLVLPLSH